MRFWASQKVPAGRPLADSRFRHDLAPRAPLGAQGGNLAGIYPRPSEALSLGPSIAQPRLHALLNQRALELSHSTDDLKHEPARRRAEIQVVAETHESDAARLELRECVQQVAE